MLRYPEKSSLELSWDGENKQLLIGIPSELSQPLSEYENFVSMFSKVKESRFVKEEWTHPNETGWGFGKVLTPYTGATALTLPVWAVDLKVHSGESQEDWDRERQKLFSISATLHVLVTVAEYFLQEGKLATEKPPTALLHLSYLTFAPSRCAMAPEVILMPGLVECVKTFTHPEIETGPFDYTVHKYPSLAMKAAWMAMSGEDIAVGYSCRAVGCCAHDGRLFFQCGKDRTTLFVPPEFRPDDPGPLKLLEHNMDFVDHQLVALVGLAALCDEARSQKEG